MSLDLLPSEYAAQLAIGAIRPWTGHHAGSASLFEVRPPHIPCDVRPVFDEDLDCIIGYHRVFRERCYLYDLTGDMAAIWEGMKDLPPPAQHDTLLVAGGLWAANVRGMTALGIAGSGVALAPTTLAQLRKRFAGLTQVPLHFTECRARQHGRCAALCATAFPAAGDATGPARQRARGMAGCGALSGQDVDHATALHPGPGHRR
ncbi:hypothetical protein [Cupriavidus sp. RAF12]|uniref:hypothetical protein n=1 Tax=Cupriavidus sp. RAF12 TaxID=3233050 RepID=UPI003F92EC23